MILNEKMSMHKFMNEKLKDSNIFTKGQNELFLTFLWPKYIIKNVKY